VKGSIPTDIWKAIWMLIVGFAIFGLAMYELTLL